MAEKLFRADAAIMDDVVQPQQNKEKLGKQDKTLAGKVDRQEQDGGQT